MAKLVTVEEMLAIEKAADAAGHSYAAMMEAAGQSLAEAVLAYSHTKAKRVLALVGSGNNGGDALVALAVLAQSGWKVTAYLVGEREDEYLKRIKDEGGTTIIAANDTDNAQLKNLIGKADVLLDGMLGTGTRLPLRQPLPAVLSAVGEALVACQDPPLVVAVDCPSGMDVASGQVAPETLAADLTVSMAAVKQGMLSLPAYAFLGELVVGEIGLPEGLPAWEAIQRYAVDEGMAYAALPERPLGSHKGTFGTALIVAGARQYPGAPLLAARAAYRIGAGLVTIAAPEAVRVAMAGQLPEATWLPLPDEEGWLAQAAVDALEPGLARATAMLLGPGMGTESTTGAFIKDLLDRDLPPLVVDADGLKLLAKLEQWPQWLPAGSVLTPHPGEMAIISGLDKEEIQQKRIETAEHFAREWGQVLVLKGTFTIITAPDGCTALIPVTTDALATAGTGDVLAGCIAGLMAQGVAPFEAAYAAAWFGAQASLLAAERLGGAAGVLAGDLIEELPGLLG